MRENLPTPGKRRIVVRLTARERGDPRALLAAVRNVLSGEGIIITLRTLEQKEAAAESPVRPDEALETKARKLAEATLDAEAAKAEKKKAANERDTERYRAEIVAQRAGLRAYVSYWLGQGVRIAVELCMRAVELLTKNVGKPD